MMHGAKYQLWQTELESVKIVVNNQIRWKVSSVNN